MHLRSATALTAAAAVAAALVLGTEAQAAAPVPPLLCTSDSGGDLELVVMGADGAVRPLTTNRVDDFGGVWSPDGRTVAFVSSRDGDDEIWTVRADGTGLRQLTGNGVLRGGGPVLDHAPAWSPDGRHLAFVSNRDGGEMEVYRMRADGSAQVRLTRTARHVTDHPVLVPRRRLDRLQQRPRVARQRGGLPHAVGRQPRHSADAHARRRGRQRTRRLPRRAADRLLEHPLPRSARRLHEGRGRP